MTKPRLRLSAEIQCWPLWLLENDGSIVANVDPSDLELSDELNTRLYEWAAIWDSQYRLSDPQDSLAGEEIDMVTFRRRGREILDRLEEECGHIFKITYNEAQVER